MEGLGRDGQQHHGGNRGAVPAVHRRRRGQVAGGGRSCWSGGGGSSSSGSGGSPGPLGGGSQAKPADDRRHPFEVWQWKRKLVTYLRRSGVPNWQDVFDQHSVFFDCMESAVEDRVMHHDRYEETAAVLPADPVPDGSSLELLDEVYLEEVPLFNRRLEFFQMRQRTAERETVEQFKELLEAQAQKAEVHLMTREDLIMFRCHTGVVEEGMLVEWRWLELPSLPEMKRAITRYKVGKAQKKALKKDRERDARAA